MSRDLLFSSALCKLLVDPIQHSRLLNEFGSGINIQKDTIGEQTRLSQVTWPHFKVVLGDLDPFVLLEVLGEFTNLFEILRPENLFDHHVQKLKDSLSHFTVHLLLLVEVEGSAVLNG